ncbi:fibronectin type III-like domain-contianing protein [Streptomyces sp. FXJ1.4098]|nr:fibronectin type III-like domain-contianing protein [Streptomyces sp. FXJ1.4098]
MVRLYVHGEFASVVRPVRQLIAFRCVDLAAGEAESLVLEAPVERLYYALADGGRGIEPGEVTGRAGLASDALSCVVATSVDEAANRV